MAGFLVIGYGGQNRIEYHAHLSAIGNRSAAQEVRNRVGAMELRTEKEGEHHEPMKVDLIGKSTSSAVAYGDSTAFDNFDG
jgi:hypothetical protein